MSTIWPAWRKSFAPDRTKTIKFSWPRGNHRVAIFVKGKAVAADKKIKVVFTEDYEVQDEHAGTPRETKYKMGEQKMFAEASAVHFISRGVAGLVTK